MSFDSTAEASIPAREVDRCTIFVGSMGTRLPALPEQAFLLAYERMTLLAQATAERSVVVAAVDASGQVLASLRVLDGQALVIGRHHQCGLRLSAPAVSLRHVACLVQLPGGGVRMHLRDLATDHPFTTEDGQESAGVTAEGAVYIALGEYALWFVPSDALPGGRQTAEEAWNALPPRVLEERRPPEGAPKPDARRAPAESELPPPESIRKERLEVTRVTRIDSPLLLEEGDAPEVAWGTVRIEGGRRKVRRWVSAERLEQGILVGRYDRCGIRIETPAPTASRVHALLTRLGADVWIIDLASKNGIQRGTRAVIAEILRDHDCLTLGDATLTWDRIVHPEA